MNDETMKRVQEASAAADPSEPSTVDLLNQAAQALLLNVIDQAEVARPEEAYDLAQAVRTIGELFDPNVGPLARVNNSRKDSTR